MFGYKGNIARKAFHVCMFRHTVGDTNPNQKGKYSHIDRRTRLVYNVVCDLIIDQDEVLRRVLLPTISISIILGYVLLARYMDEVFAAFHMGIFRSGMGCCALLSDEDFELLAPPISTFLLCL